MSIIERIIAAWLCIVANNPSYAQGFVRVDSEGKNRGSFMPGLDTLEKTLDFLKGLVWEVDTTVAKPRPGCAYFIARLSEKLAFESIALLGELTDEELGLVRIRNGKHGLEFYFEGSKKFTPTDEIRIVLGPEEYGEVVYTWYPGRNTISIPLDQLQQIAVKL